MVFKHHYKKNKLCLDEGVEAYELKDNYDLYRYYPDIYNSVSYQISEPVIVEDKFS